MKDETIYRSVDGKSRILDLYDKFLSELSVKYEEITVETRFGPTHFIISGPKTAPPVIIFHGGNSLNPFDFRNITSLTDKYRVYAPDTIGHPGKSAETRLSPNDNSYGEWALDFLDALNLKKPAFIGPSFGAGILLQLASIAPERISTAIFIVPSGFANSSGLSIMGKLVFPLIKYRLKPNHKNAMKTLLPLIQKIDEDMVFMTEMLFRDLKIASRMPRPMKKDELKGFSAPVLVLAADKDILFPGNKVIRSAKVILPNLIESELLPDTPHAFYTAEWDCKEYVVKKLLEFLDNHYIG